MIRGKDCLRFFYESRTNEEELELHSRVQFTVQAPIDNALPERAIVVKFSAQGSDEKFKLGCLCRIIFDFSDTKELLDESELLRRYQAEAYLETTKLINDALAAIGQNQMDFPDI